MLVIVDVDVSLNAVIEFDVVEVKEVVVVSLVVVDELNVVCYN